jgi:hypothetical protein
MSGVQYDERSLDTVLGVLPPTNSRHWKIGAMRSRCEHPKRIIASPDTTRIGPGRTLSQNWFVMWNDWPPVFQ